MIVAIGFGSPHKYRGGCLSIGNFDGVHLGHQLMLRTLVDRARDVGGPAVVMTFDPHPTTILSNRVSPPLLCTREEKLRLIEACGVDCVVVYPTNRALLALSAKEFYQQVIVEEIQARGLVEGPNFYFGKDRSGDVAKLREFGAAHDIDTYIVDAVAQVSETGEMISSSMVRQALSQGTIERANGMLGREYSVSGIVTSGAGRGRTLGFPTANLEQIETLIPADGVYVGCCDIDAQQYAAAVHVGTNPTFGDDTRKVEVHLLDYTGDLYGQSLDVAFVSRIRGTERFESAAQLEARIKLDIDAVRERSNRDAGS